MFYVCPVCGSTAYYNSYHHRIVCTSCSKEWNKDKLTWYNSGDNVFAELGILRISCVKGRKFSDSTNQIMIYLSIPDGSKDIITVHKIRGHIQDAKNKAEELFSDLIK